MLFWLVGTAAQGQLIRSLTIENAALPRPIDFVNAKGTQFQPDSVGADSLKIVSAFHDEGYFDCRVVPSYRIGGMRVDLKYKIIPGPRYMLSVSTEITGSDTSSPFDFDDLNESYSGLPATAGNIRKLAFELLERAANAGFPYAEVGYDDFRGISENRLALKAKINLGPKVTIQGLNFPGRHFIDQTFLEYYCLFKPGLAYSNRKMKSIGRRLNGAIFLKSIGLPELKYSGYPQYGVIEIPIIERPAMRIDGLVGLASKTKKMFGKIDIMVSNVFGRGRQLRIGWSKKDEYSGNKELEYFEPCIMNWPVDGRIAAFQFDYDSLYIETGAELGLGLATVSGYAYKFGFGAAQISPESYGKSIIPPKDRFNLLLGFQADTRDYSDNPRRGEFVTIDWRFFVENRHNNAISNSSGDSYRRIDMMAGKLVPVTNSAVLMARIVGKAIFGEKSTMDRQFLLGGTGSLRGYDQDIFRTARYAVATIEYRHIYGKDGRAYLFADLAGIDTKSMSAYSRSETLFKAGFGAGIASKIAPGLAILEIGFPAEGSLSEARIHFAVRTEFD